MDDTVQPSAKMGTFSIYEEQIVESDSEENVSPNHVNVSMSPEKNKIENSKEFLSGDSVVMMSDDYSEGKRRNSQNSDVTIQIDNVSPIPIGSNKAQDTLSIASSSSLSSTSTTSSSTSTMRDPGKKQHLSTHGVSHIKVLGPSSESHNRSQIQGQPHPRIRRVPSTANPKYKIPNLGRQQRSHSQPQLQFHSIQSQRRNSSPSLLGLPANLVNLHQANSKQQVPQNAPHLQLPILNPVNLQQHQPQAPLQQQSQNGPNQQQQQIIYLQIPQPSPSQICDPQSLQQQISSQLQQLVPQIYTQLLNKITVEKTSTPTNGKHSAQSNKTTTSTVEPKEAKTLPENNYANATFSTDANSQRVMNQILDQNSYAKIDQKVQQSSQPKKVGKTNTSQTPKQNKSSTTDHSTQISSEDISKYLQIENISQILQQIPPHILHQNTESCIEIQQMPGYPKITIPITQELLMQCQQFQQNRDLGGGFVPYQPGLETILEESMSVKHMKINKFPKTNKTKLIACILTVLCVVVVVLLAGDKTVAVVVVAVVFIVFLLASIFYLYLNSSRNQMTPALNHTDSQRIQVNAIAVDDKSSGLV